MRGILKRRSRAAPPLTDQSHSRTTSSIGIDDSTATADLHLHHHHHHHHNANHNSSSDLDNASSSRRVSETITAAAAVAATSSASASRFRRLHSASLFRASARALRYVCAWVAAAPGYARLVTPASLARRCTRPVRRYRRHHPTAFAAVAVTLLAAFLLCGFALCLVVCTAHVVVSAEAAAVAARAPYVALAGGAEWVSDAPAVQLRAALQRHATVGHLLVRLLSLEVVTAVHEATTAALAVVGVDLTRMELRLAWRVAQHLDSPREAAGADADGAGGGDVGGNACCPGACVSHRAGNTSSQTWDPTAAPPPPFALDASAAPDACPRRASQWTASTSSRARPPRRERLRPRSRHSGRAARRLELADRDSTVLLLFDSLARRAPPETPEAWFDVEGDGGGSDDDAPSVCGGEEVHAGTTKPHGAARDDGVGADRVGVTWRPFRYSRRRLERAFSEAAAAFVSDRHDPFAAAVHGTPSPAAGHHGADADLTGSPYMSFARQQRATLWELYPTTQGAEAQERGQQQEQQHGAFPTSSHARRRLARPLRMDVVLTYVSPAAASHRRARVVRGMAEATADANRMRDWGELRYALRSLDAHALRSRALQHYPRQLRADVEVLETEMGIEVSPSVRAALAAGGGGDGAVSLLGDVILVVADVDQVPTWVREWRAPLDGASAAHTLRVVKHAQLLERAAEAVSTRRRNGGHCHPGSRATSTTPVAGEARPLRSGLQSTVGSHPCLFFENQTRGAVTGSVLPTFNSRVIESLLHHTPGLSRFYLYATNDQLLGQQLSFFDMWRPLAPARQEMRFAAYAAEVTAARARSAPPPDVCRQSSTSGGARSAYNATAGTAHLDRTPTDKAEAARASTCRSAPPPVPRSGRRALFMEPLLQREVTVSPWQPTVQYSPPHQTVRHASNASAVRRHPTSAPAGSRSRHAEEEEGAQAEAESRVQRQLESLRVAAAEALRACEQVRQGGAPYRPVSLPGSGGDVLGDDEAAGVGEGEADDAAEDEEQEGLARASGGTPRRLRTVMPGRIHSAESDADARTRDARGSAAAAAVAGPSDFDRCVAAETSQRFLRRHAASPTAAPVAPRPSSLATTSTGLATRPLMRVPAWQLESAHGTHQWHMALEHWDGVTPALLYPHAMTLLDREWVSDALDDVMRDELQLMRLHSTRFRYGEFIPVSAFVYYAVAMRRWVDRQWWALGLESDLERVTVVNRGERGDVDAAGVEAGRAVTRMLALRPPARRAVASSSLLDPFTSITLHDAAAALEPLLFPAGARRNGTRTGNAEHLEQPAAHAEERLAAADVDGRLASLAHDARRTNQPLLPEMPPALHACARRQLDVERRRRDELRRVIDRGWVAAPQLELCRRPRPRRVRMDDLGPLYGDAHGVHVQHPMLLDHLASWWLSAGLPPSPHPCRSNPLRDGPRTRPDLLQFPILLRHALPLPHLRVHRRTNASGAATTPDAVAQRRQRQRTRQWKALFLDVDYHWRDGWPSDEVDDDAPWKSLYSAASGLVPHHATPPPEHPATTEALGFVALTALEQMEALIHRFRTSPTLRPVQCVFNDNFPLRASAMVDGVPDRAWNETFTTLMDVYTGNLPRSRWEAAPQQP